MIKVNELRIGNYIYYCGFDENEIAEVTGIIVLGKDKYNLVIDAHSQDGKTRTASRVQMEAVAPIPLTPEWLERCGLKQKPLEPDDLPQWSNLNMNIAQYTDGFYLYTVTSDPWHDQAVGKKIEYVHTLQNISLDLFSEELNVKL